MQEESAMISIFPARAGQPRCAPIVIGLTFASAAPGCSPDAPARPEVSFWSGSQRIEALRETEPFVIRFAGGPPRARVTLRSRFRGYRGWASYVADATGAVDVS